MNNLQTEKGFVKQAATNNSSNFMLCRHVFLDILWGKNLLQPNVHNLQEKDSETKQKIYVDYER